jgi:hypothetical protein
MVKVDEVPNTLAHYNMATISAVTSFLQNGLQEKKTPAYLLAAIKTMDDGVLPHFRLG